MDFLDRFSPRDRDRLASAATTVRLGPGEFLIRRGERGGDLYRVADGELQIIDTRQQPVVVLGVIQRGAAVGEMAFLDESARSADVRAADLAVCQRWDRAALHRLLDEDPALGAAFYRALAALVSERSRQVITNAVTGSLSVPTGRPRGNDAAAALGRQWATQLRDRLLEIEPAIRRDRARAHGETLAALQNFTVVFAEGLARLSDEDQVEAGHAAARELHPYVVRSRLGEVAVDRPTGHASDPQALVLVDGGLPSGDGPLGEFFDEWLLGLPTARAFRERRALAVEAVTEAIPPVEPLHLVVVGAAGGTLLRGLVPYLDRTRGELTVIDGSREELVRADQVLSPRPPDLRLRLLQEDLAAFCLGRGSTGAENQQIVVIDGLLDHLPARAAASLLRVAATWLRPGGALLATALGPSADEPVFRFLTAWPTVRRSAPALRVLVASSGYEEARVWAAGSAGQVLAARRPLPGTTSMLLADLETESVPA